MRLNTRFSLIFVCRRIGREKQKHEHRNKIYTHMKTRINTQESKKQKLSHTHRKKNTKREKGGTVSVPLHVGRHVVSRRTLAPNTVQKSSRQTKNNLKNNITIETLKNQK